MLAIIHIIVMLCLRLAWLMLIPFMLIRMPRFVLHCCARRAQDRTNYNREFQFRKWSCICYFPLAVTIQMIQMAVNFCAPEIYLSTSQCMTGYSIALILALAIHQVIDVYLFLRVKKFYESKDAEIGGTAPPQVIEMSANNMI